ncbi:MAG: ABC transporter substrate-binding protein [Desulfuromonadaceae bacterium]
MRNRNWLVFLVFIVSLPGFISGEARAEKRIGVFTFSEEGRYVEATKAFKDKLSEAGFGESKVTYFSENAEGNKAKAAEIVKRFAALKLDLILSLGTSATVPLSREIKDVPIVFSVVYDPVDAGIATSWKSSGNNTTGSSPLVPMSKLMDSLKKLAPVKRLAVLYTPGEKNSETQVRELQKLENSYKIKVLPVRLENAGEVERLLPEVLRASDALYITGSNVVNSKIQTIVDLSAKAKVITITHLEDLIVKGVLMGVVADSYSGGRASGEKAVKILKGAMPSSIPISISTKNSVILNMNTVKKGAFVIPAEFMKTVTKKIE